VKRFILAVFCVAATVAPLLAQAQKDSLASLIEAGNRKAALEKIRTGADVNEAQPDGTRPIHWAAYKLDYDLLQALIAKKAKVNVTNEFGSIPLAEAATLGDARMVKMLLDAGAEPESANPDGQTALMLAVKTGELPIVEMLIKAGANVNAVEKFHHQTALMWAVAAPKNAGQIVKLLLSKGADAKVRALYTDWPSQITSEPRAQYRPTGGLTALLYAARDGCYDCVESLIGAGADANVPTPEGVTALMIALDNDHNDIAKLLLDRGANPNVWDWWGRTALYIVVDRKEGGSSRGLNPGGRSVVDAPKRDGILAAAARVSGRPPVPDMEIINALLAAGVDPGPELNMHRPSRGGNSGRFIDPLLNTGCTPLLRATMVGDLELVKSLLAKGASPNVDDMGLTAFLVAAGVGTGTRGGTGLAAQAAAGSPANLPLMALLLEHGADINTQITGTKTYSMRIARAPSANEGMTALHWAALTGKTDVVRFLLDKGANPEILDSDGHKPIDLVTSSAPRQAPPADGGVAAGGAARAPRTAEAGARGGPGEGKGAATQPSVAEIRALLQNAASSK
jgi:uncharacterized protein